MAKKPSKKEGKVELFELIRKVKHENDEDAYQKIYQEMKSDIDRFCMQFHIQGLANDDINQECQCALRYKAIKSFNPKKGSFRTFAVLCLKRHLYSISKGNQQNKKKALNVSISLDESHNENGEDLQLKNIIADESTGNMEEDIALREDEKIKHEKLKNKLSDLEKAIYLLYIKKYRYDEIVDELIEQGWENIGKKSIDNAVQRLRFKAKELFWKKSSKKRRKMKKKK